MKLAASDVFNFYGLTMLSGPAYAAFHSIRRGFLLEIKAKYVDSLKSRIKAEAGYINLDVDGDNIHTIIRKITDHLDSAIESQLDSMRAGNAFDVLSFVKQFHDQAPKGMECAPDLFRSDEGKKRQMFGGEPWAKISEAFLNIEKAKTDTEIILAIDALNSLQHNTNYVLVDIAGVRGVDELRALMQEKAEVDPKDVAHKMSPEVCDLLKDAGILKTRR